MSRTTMNCTALRSASASHLRRSDATMSSVPFIPIEEACNLTDRTCLLQVSSSQRQADALQWHSHAEKLRAVLPDRARPRPRRGAVGAPGGARADARPEALHG